MAEAPQKPNILLITTDQQRYDTCGPRAPSFMRTPHFDDLARQGISFSRAYAECPICVPARVSIMTGQSNFTHGMFTNGETKDWIDNARSLPSCMRSLGYQTAAIGKMHFGPERARHGFDEMLIPTDYYRQMLQNGAQQKPMRHGLGQNELYPGMATVPESQTLTAWIAEQCVEYIRERRDPTAPFFLWCSFSKPHPPLDPPEPYYSMYRNCSIPDPIYGNWSDDKHAPPSFRRFRQSWSLDLIPQKVIREARAAYYGLITQIDYNIGRVFAALMDKGLFDDTLIIYTSDHGEFLGDFRTGAKMFFHEPSAHVPFVVRLPKSWENRMHGQTVDALVTHADILPTIMRAAGGQAPDVCDGRDLIATARGQAPPRKHLECMCPNLHTSITDGTWKYMYYPEGGCEQLFDLENDPHELHNLAGDAEYQQQRQAMRAALIERHSARGSNLVENGDLVVQPVKGTPVEDIRNRSWPGYHTEYLDVDVRH